MELKESTLPLGAIYSAQGTTFRVWATQADALYLNLYTEAEGPDGLCYVMNSLPDNIYEYTVSGDLAGQYYTYRVVRGQTQTEVTDPYCLSASLNSERSAIVDLSRTDPPGFKQHARPRLSFKEAVICESHVRDMTIHDSLELEHPGTFLGLTEKREVEGFPTGLDYLAYLGVTHLHLMPVQDFISVDEKKGGYNWGYDPELYFCLEGSYVVDTLDPHKRIYEFKQLVQHAHEKGLGIVMDVVYNHTFKSYDSNLNVLAPNYYYRKDGWGNFTNGSGCGNEIDTEKFMARRLIVESLAYFVKECQVDGFRFDLLGIMDIATTKQIIRLLRELHPEVLIYGEPWGGGQTGLLLEKMTLQGVQKKEEFALFNDNYRDALKGKNDDASLGYIQGNILGRTGVVTGITGSINFSDQIFGYTDEPFESINYHSSHDNLILYDKLKLSTGKSDEEITRLTKLLFSIQLMSFGLPFFHLGTEFNRSKQMHHNSYNLSDAINRIDWRQVSANQDLVEYVRHIIQLRKRIDAFQQYRKEDIREKLVFLYSHMEIAYTLELGDDEFERLLIAHNPTPETKIIPFDIKDAILLAHDGQWKEIPYTDELLLPYSSMILGIKRRQHGETLSH